MSEDFTDDKSTLVQVMALCPQAQAITCTNVDPVPCRHMASPGHNELYGPCMILTNECPIESRYVVKTQSPLLLPGITVKLRHLV